MILNFKMFRCEIKSNINSSPWSGLRVLSSLSTEWRSGRSGHLPLQDEDVTTEIKHKMKHVNTLAHYHIPDHSEMTLVRKHDSNEGVRKVHGKDGGLQKNSQIP